jgi:hypothetical protein
MRLRSLAFPGWVALLVCAGCGTKIQEQYQIDVVTPGGDDYLAGAASAVLEIGNQSYTTKVTPGAPFTLSGGNVSIPTEMAGIFRVKVLDDHGQVLAQGQSPEVELLLTSPPVIRIFIQKPGSFGRTQDLDYPRRHMVAVAAPAPPSLAATAQARSITVAFFGLGTVLVPSGNTTVEQPSEVFSIYNPITHFMDDGGLSGPLGGTRQPRTDAAAVVHADGKALVFGGTATPAMMAPQPSAQLDIVTLSRTGFDQFTPSVSVRAPEPSLGIARAKPAMVDTSSTAANTLPAYVIGGIGEKVEMPGMQQPLDTIVSVSTAVDSTFRLLTAHMAAPRVGHTATLVTSQGMKEVLIFGGAAAGQPVAEVLATNDMLTTLSAPGVAQRRDHAALALSNDRVIIIGGRNDVGVLGDSVLYHVDTRTFEPGPITLQTPRYGFTSFVVNDDLVVAGGFDALGAPLDNAEIYSATDLHLKAMKVPCRKRAEASAVVLPNQSVLIVGGTEDGDKPSVVAEIYQPLR